MAISLFSKPYEIASVVSLPRNDIATHSPGEGRFYGESPGLGTPITLKGG